VGTVAIASVEYSIRAAVRRRLGLPAECLPPEDVHENLARDGAAMVMCTGRPVQAVLFGYGGVLRRDERASTYDAIDAAFGLPSGAL
jgi:hypothetical protein